MTPPNLNRRVVCCAVAIAVAGAVTPSIPTAHAQTPISPGARVPELRLDEDYLTLTADFDVALTPTLEEALARGVALYFVLETDVQRTRLLIDESVGSRRDEFRLAYVPLTRSWRLGSGLFTQNFPSLEAAVRQFTRLRGYKIIERKALQKGERYTISVRLRHDINQLPKPLQLNALASRDWSLDVDPIKLSYTP